MKVELTIDFADIDFEHEDMTELIRRETAKLIATKLLDTVRRGLDEKLQGMVTELIQASVIRVCGEGALEIRLDDYIRNILNQKVDAKTGTPTYSGIPLFEYLTSKAYLGKLEKLKTDIERDMTSAITNDVRKWYKEELTAKLQDKVIEAMKKGL